MWKILWSKQIGHLARALGFVRHNLYPCSENKKRSAYVTIVRPNLDWNSLLSGIRTSTNFSLFKDHCFTVQLLEMIDRCHLFICCIYLIYLYIYILYLLRNNFIFLFLFLFYCCISDIVVYLIYIDLMRKRCQLINVDVDILQKTVVRCP